jgi:hypothetical protein
MALGCHLGSRGARCVRLTTLPPSCVVCKFWVRQPPGTLGPVQAHVAIALPFLSNEPIRHLDKYKDLCFFFRYCREDTNPSLQFVMAAFSFRSQLVFRFLMKTNDDF